MNLQGFYTNQGRALAAKIAGGTAALTVTRVDAGSGHTADIASATVLPDTEQTLTVGAAQVSGSTATLPVTLSEAAAEDDYTLTELGVYATDPDEGEVLFQVYQLDAAVDVTALGEGTLRFYLRQSIGAQGVSVVCSGAGTLVEGDLQPVWDAIGSRVEASRGISTLHVAKTGSDTTGDGSEQHPYLTIQKAIDSLPKYLLHKTTIRVHTGTYHERLEISGFFGELWLTSANDDFSTFESVTVEKIEVKNCSSVAIIGLNVNNPNEGDKDNAIYIVNCGFCGLMNVSSTNAVTTEQTYGSLRAESGSVVNLMYCTITGKKQVVEAAGSVIYLTIGNTIAMAAGGYAALHAGTQYVTCGGMIFKGSGSYSGTEIKHYGGQIWS